MTELTNDMRRLIIAARNVAFSTTPSPEALKELDAASEAFADIVPWDDEPWDEAPSPTPESLCSSYLACSVGVVPCACEHNASATSKHLAPDYGEWDQGEMT